MDENSISKISLEQVAEYILWDCDAWKGVSLFYTFPQHEGEEQPAKARMAQWVRENQGALFFDSPQHGQMLLGAKTAAGFDGLTPENHIWAADIATEGDKVCGTLRRFVPANPPPRYKKPSSYSILIVEDEPLLNKMMTQYLEQKIVTEGTVISTSNYHEAIANYMVQSPSLVFLDINYYGDDMNGFDVLKNILIYDSNAFIVMVSGDASLKTRLQAFASGAQGFIGKPFNPADLSRYLTRLHVGA